jgi:hypothetical protein
MRWIDASSAGNVSGCILETPFTIPGFANDVSNSFIRNGSSAIREARHLGVEYGVFLGSVESVKV